MRIRKNLIWVLPLSIIALNLFLFFVKNIGWETYKTSTTFSPGSRLPSVNSIVFDNEGRAWMARGRGEGISLLADGTWTTYREKDPKRTEVGVNQLLIDNNNQLWLVNAHSDWKSFVQSEWTQKNIEGDYWGGASDLIMSLDSQGRIWFANTRNGLTIYDNGELHNIYVHWSSFDEVAFDGSGKGWIAFSGGKLYSIDEDAYIETQERIFSKDIYGIETIAIDNYGNVWVGKQKGGILIYDGETWSNLETSNTGSETDWVKEIAFDNKNNAWIAPGSQGGMTFDWLNLNLVVFDGEDWIKYNKYNSGLPSNIVLDIVFDDEGKGWIGTTGGLAIVSPEELPNIPAFIRPLIYTKYMWIVNLIFFPSWFVVVFLIYLERRKSDPKVKDVGE